MASEITLDTIVEKAPDSEACGIRVSSSDVMRWFGRKSRVPVQATLNGYTYRSSLSPMDGAHLLPVNADVRRNAEVAAGQRVKLTLREDNDPRTVDVPEDLERALAQGRIRATFDEMSFTHRKEWVRAVLDAKRPETRTKRISDCATAMQARAAGKNGK